MTTTCDEIDVKHIQSWINRIQELTSTTDFEVSAELLQLLDDLLTESKRGLSNQAGDIITAVNAVDGACCSLPPKWVVLSKGNVTKMECRELPEISKVLFSKSKKASDVLVRIVSILSEKGDLSQEEEQCLRTTYFCIYNFSDGREFARSAANTCIIKKCIENLKTKEDLIFGDSQIDEDAADVIDYSLSIIYNISKEENIIGSFENDLSILHRYKNAKREDFVALSVMILAHLSDDEVEKIHDEKDTVAYLIQLLQRAITDEERRAVGFSCAELIEGLGNLALNDSNKLTIFEKDGIPLLMDLIRSEIEEEQVAAAQCIWTLAFLPSIQRELQHFRGEFGALSKSCNNKVLRKTLEGILLTLGKRSEITKDRQSNDGHIMISYAWDGAYGEKAARKIASYLKSRGLKVWIDTDEMRGSFLDAMAQAVSDSYAFVMCASEQYRKSNNCRLEASTAHIQDKTIIPVVMDSEIQSKVDWLMLLCSDKLYVDFTDESKFHQKCEELVQQIVRLSQRVDETDFVVPETAHETTSQPKAQQSVARWSPPDVKIWLRDNDLQCFEEEFEEFNGSALIRLRKMQQEAPDFFYRYFCEVRNEKGKGKLIDVIKLTEAIERL